MTKLVIRAIPATDKMTGEQGYQAIADNGDQIYEGRIIKTRRQVYIELEQSYGNPVWQGRKIHSGYEIETD